MFIGQYYTNVYKMLIGKTVFGVYGKSLYHHQNFSVNLELFKNYSKKSRRTSFLTNFRLRLKTD